MLAAILAMAGTRAAVSGAQLLAAVSAHKKPVALGATGHVQSSAEAVGARAAAEVAALKRRSARLRAPEIVGRLLLLSALVARHVHRVARGARDLHVRSTLFGELYAARLVTGEARAVATREHQIGRLLAFVPVLRRGARNLVGVSAVGDQLVDKNNALTTALVLRIIHFTLKFCVCVIQL